MSVKRPTNKQPEPKRLGRVQIETKTVGVLLPVNLLTRLATLETQRGYRMVSLSQLFTRRLADWLAEVEGGSDADQDVAKATEP